MSNVENTLSPAQAEVNRLVEKGLVALEQFRQLNQDQVNYIVAKASVAALDQHGVLAMHAYEETGRGVFEDKATKNLFACEYVVNNMRHLKTVGIISEDDVTHNNLLHTLQKSSMTLRLPPEHQKIVFNGSKNHPWKAHPL